MEIKKVVFLDWSGTLSTSKFWGHWEKENPQVYNQIQEYLFGGELTKLLNPWMLGEIKSEDVTSKLANKINQHPDYLFTHLKQSAEQMQFVNPTIPLLVKTLQNKGLKVVIATDNMDTFSRWTVPAMKLQMLFDGILNSYTLRARKKDLDSNNKSLFFATFLEENSIKPAESVLLDDSEDKNSIFEKIGIDYQRIKSSEDLLAKLKLLAI